MNSYSDLFVFGVEETYYTWLKLKMSLITLWKHTTNSTNRILSGFDQTFKTSYYTEKFYSAPKIFCVFCNIQQKKFLIPHADYMSTLCTTLANLFQSSDILRWIAMPCMKPVR